MGNVSLLLKLSVVIRLNIIDYPFKPPRLRFLTPLYHAVVNERGGTFATNAAL
jgi:ubiquitin-protein ligase